jgi:hypothetical protein
LLQDRQYSIVFTSLGYFISMRPSQSPAVLSSLLIALLSLYRPAVAKPYPREGSIAELEESSLLEKRDCANPCGWTGQLCCAANQQCITDAAGQAQCSNGGGQAAGAQGGGQWQYFTTTWVETGLVTRVSTYSSYISAATTAPPTVQAFVPTTSTVVAVTTQAPCAIPCGGICCAHGQYCATAGQCAAVGAGGFSSSYYQSVFTTYYTSSQTFIAPLRPTSGTVTTTTSIIGGVVTATVPFQTPIGTAGSIVYGTAAASGGGGLSGGAIAGIVIGVLLALLLLILALCWNSITRRRSRRTTTTYIHERHHRHGGGGGGGGRTWYGGRRPSPNGPPRRGGGLGGIGAVLTGLGGLALALGLKRRAERHKEDDYSYSTGSETSYGSSVGYTDTSESEFLSPPFFTHSVLWLACFHKILSADEKLGL